MERVLGSGMQFQPADEIAFTNRRVFVANDLENFQVWKRADTELATRCHVLILGWPLGAGDVTTCVGPAGTVIFSDVASYYHRGKPALSQDRCAVFYNYISNAPLRPFYCGRTVLSRTQIAQLVADLPPTTQASALWRDQLPWFARMVPLTPL